jgi:hypothetical protein
MGKPWRVMASSCALSAVGPGFCRV